MRGLLIIVTATILMAETTYQQEIAKWRADRETKLKADDGWLTVVGLHWLKEGVNRAGSNPDFEVPLPNSLPRSIGTFTLAAGVVHFKPAAGVALKEMDLKPDTDAHYDVLMLGRV